VVLFPVLSRRADLPRPQLRERLLKHRGRALMGTALLLAPAIGFADQVILLLYDDRYLDAAWMLPIMLVGFWPVALDTSISPCLLALGKPQYNLLGSIPRVIFVTIGCLVGFRLYGVPGLVAAMAIGPLVRYMGIMCGLWRERMLAVRQDVLTTLMLIAALAAVLAIRFICGFGTPLDLMPVG